GRRRRARRPRRPPAVTRRRLPHADGQRHRRRGRMSGQAGVALAFRDTAGVAKRNLLRIVRTPLMLIVTAVQPALLLLLFRYVLGGAILVPGGSYVNYLVPAVFVEAVLIGGMTTSIGLAQDMKSGIVDRFRSLPMARSAVLAGRTLADFARTLFSLAIMIGLG